MFGLLSKCFGWILLINTLMNLLAVKNIKDYKTKTDTSQLMYSKAYFNSTLSLYCCWLWMYIHV